MKKHLQTISNSLQCLILAICINCALPLLAENTSDYQSPPKPAPLIEDITPVQDNNTPEVQPTPQPQPAPVYEAMPPTKPRWEDTPVENTPPAPKPANEKKTQEKPPVTQNNVYVVKPGDNPSRIANSHGISLVALLTANQLDEESSRKIQPGQKLIIPENTTTATITPKTTKPQPTPPPSTPSTKTDADYIVKPGDTLYSIATKHGISVSKLQQLNHLSDEAVKRLQVGQKLVVSNEAKPAPTPATAPAPAPVPKPEATTPPPVATASKPEPPAVASISATPEKPVTPTQETTKPSPAPVAENDKPKETLPTPPSNDNIDDIINGDTRLFEVTDNHTTLEDVAARYNTTLKAVKQLNPELTQGIKLPKGTVIFIPAE